MSRQSKITEALHCLKQRRIIREFHCENEPGRKDGGSTGLHWHVMVGPLSTEYFTTKEVEAFIAGADSVFRVVETQPIVA